MPDIFISLYHLILGTGKLSLKYCKADGDLQLSIVVLSPSWKPLAWKLVMIGGRADRGARRHLKSECGWSSHGTRGHNHKGSLSALALFSFCFQALSKLQGMDHTDLLDCQFCSEYFRKELFLYYENADTVFVWPLNIRQCNFREISSDFELNQDMIVQFCGLLLSKILRYIAQGLFHGWKTRFWFTLAESQGEKIKAYIN